MSVNKNIMKMNDGQTMSFVDFYEREEVLWNTKLESYRNRDARGEAVKRIVSAMNIEGFGPDHVISKFKNLRSSYCQELKKIATSKKSGTSSEDVYVPHVVWFTKMDSFLRPYVTMRDTCSNYVISNENKSNPIETINREDQVMSELDETSQNQVSSETKESSQIEVSNNESESNLTEPIPGSNVYTTIKRKLCKSPQKRVWNLKKRKLETFKFSSNCEIDTVLAAVKRLDRITERAQILAENSKREDSFDQFGKYVASVLRDFPLKKACLLQKKITNMIINEIIENDSQNAIYDQK